MTDVPAGPPGGQPGAGVTGPAGGVLVAFAGPVPQRRVTVLFRLILVVPQYAVLYALTIAAQVVAFAGWFAALFTGRLPGGMADFLAGYLRWYARVLGYIWLLTDRYPPFSMADDDYPVRVSVTPGPLNRLAVLLRVFLMIPAAIVAALAGWGAGVAALVIWLIVLIAGRMPDSLQQALAAVLRYGIRLQGYLLLLTGTYPSGLFGDRPGPGLTGWPLILSGGARKLVGLFLGLGVAGLAAVIALTVALGGSIGSQRLSAISQVGQSHAVLARTMQGLQAQAAGCRASAPCLAGLYGKAADAFSGFGSALRGTPMPDGTSAADSGKLQRDAARLAADYRVLSRATSAVQLQQSLASTGLERALQRFTSDYSQLALALGMARS